MIPFNMSCNCVQAHRACIAEFNQQNLDVLHKPPFICLATSRTPPDELEGQAYDC